MKFIADFGEHKGREFECTGEYRAYKQGDYVINSAGCVEFITWCGLHSPTRAIVHPVEKYHDFGGIRFRETGEVRAQKKNEWYLDVYNLPEYTNVTYDSQGTDRIILEPVQILSPASPFLTE